MNDLTFTQDYVVYKPKKEEIYLIKIKDWNRLKRIINAIIPNTNIFKILSSISFGIFSSSIFSLISLNTAEKIDKWVIPTTWVIFSVSLIAGIGLLILDRSQKKFITYSTNDVLAEMSEIEKTFEKPSEQV